MQDYNTESYFGNINISNAPKEGEPFQIYKARQTFTNKLIKEYLKGRIFYHTYQNVTIDKDEKGNELEKPRRFTVKNPPYVNPNKNKK